MIKQGSNKPIKLTFDVAPVDISVALHNEITAIKHWTMSDLEATPNEDGTITYTAPITQEESAAWPEGPCEIEIRWSDQDGIVWKRVIRENIEYTANSTTLNLTAETPAEPEEETTP